MAEPISPAMRRWLRHVYDTEGAVSPQAASDAYSRYALTLAEEAVAAVVNDLQRTTPFRPRVVVDTYLEDSVRISINEGYTAPSMLEIGRPEAFAEIASYFQEQLAQELGAWPICIQHDAGLHAEVRSEAAVWCCLLGDHDVADVGRLGLGPDAAT
jgi:hypothetical protein